MYADSQFLVLCSKVQTPYFRSSRFTFRVPILLDPRSSKIEGGPSRNPQQRSEHHICRCIHEVHTVNPEQCTIEASRVPVYNTGYILQINEEWPVFLCAVFKLNSGNI